MYILESETFWWFDTGGGGDTPSVGCSYLPWVAPPSLIGDFCGLKAVNSKTRPYSEKLGL